MYDITNKSSLAHMDDWLQIIKKEIRVEDMFPIIVVGGKADLAENREVLAKDAIKITKSSGIDAFIECSAKTGENVEETFKALTRLMLEFYKPREIDTGSADNKEAGSANAPSINKQISKTSDRYIPKSPKTPEDLNDLLNKLLIAIPDVKAAALVSSEGLPILVVLPHEVDETKFAAMTAALCSIAKKAITEIQNGDFHQLYITGSEGYLLIRQVTPDAILIISVDKKVGFRPFFQGDPFPYIFNPPYPPDDLDGAVQVQLSKVISLLLEKDNLNYCKHCGAPLDEGVSVCPNCKKLV